MNKYTEAIKNSTGKEVTMEEMVQYIKNNTDHKVVNELLKSGMDFDSAVALAYLEAIK